MRTLLRTVSSVVVTALLLFTTDLAIAGSGVAELTLDRAGVMALLSAALPRSESVSMPGLGEVRLTIEAVEELRFLDGEIHAVVNVKLRAPALGAAAVIGAVRVRYAPEIERTTGTARLVPLSGLPLAPLRLDADFARWLPAIDLPRRMNWSLPLGEGPAIELSMFVQGVEVEGERLRLDLGVVARPETD